MLHNKPQGHWPFGSGEKDFSYMGMAALGHVTQTPQTNFRSPTHGGSTWNLALTGQVVLKKIFENGGWMDDGQTMAIL